MKNQKQIPPSPPLSKWGVLKSPFVKGGLRGICLLLLAACAPAVTLPTTVKIPVPVQCPEPRIIPRPHLAIATLPDKPAPDQYVRAVESSLEALMGYAEQLEKQRNGYRRDAGAR